jgi:hypothetical protein
MSKRANRIIRLMLSILIISMLSAPAGAKTIYVPADFDTIQAGIDAAVDGDTVLVAPGEYVITAPITFRGKAITVRSEAGPDETTTRMGTPTDPERGTVVVFENSETAASVLEGFTITGGRGSWSLSANNWGGGGIIFDASFGTVRNCAIVENTAKNGGGVVAYFGSSATLTNCIIRGNSATGITFGVDGYGGGLFCGPSSSLTLTKCTITGNSAVRGGGGVHCWQNLSLVLTYCAITNNTVQYAGGGILCDSGSAILTHCVIARNTRASWGGGIMSAFPEAFITINNCTICENSATEGGGIGCLYGGSAKVTNSIIRGNTASKGNEIYLEQAPTGFSVAHSNLADGQAGLSVEGGCTLDWGEGNIDADPLFADPNNADFHLKSEVGRWDPNSQIWIQDEVTSPCIDVGDPDSDCSGETWPHGGRINMGAYGGTREASMSTQPEAMSLPRVALIYRSDTEAAESFRSLLMSYGCPTTLIGIEDVTMEALDLCDVIVVASDAGYSSTWQDTPFVATLDGSGKPIIGLGQGGYNFFGELELWIGRPYGGHGSKDSIEVIDPNGSLFRTPYPVDIPDDRVLQLYSETDHIGIYLWPTIPETVTVLASVVNDHGYYSLVMEHNRYLLWGFKESPLKMTEVGKTLFINVVIWTANTGWEVDI